MARACGGPAAPTSAVGGGLRLVGGGCDSRVGQQHRNMQRKAFAAAGTPAAAAPLALAARMCIPILWGVCVSAGGRSYARSLPKPLAAPPQGRAACMCACASPPVGCALISSRGAYMCSYVCVTWMEHGSSEHLEPLSCAVTRRRHAAAAPAAPQHCLLPTSHARHARLPPAALAAATACPAAAAQLQEDEPHLVRLHLRSYPPVVQVVLKASVPNAKLELPQEACGGVWCA